MNTTATTAKCTRCGRTLRSAKSIAAGMGPTCRTKVAKTTALAAKAGAYKPSVHRLRGRARLTPELVIDIRETYAAGGVSMRQLARRYGIHHSNIVRAINRRQWSEVDPAVLSPL